MTEQLPSLMAEVRAADWEQTPESVKELVENWAERFEQLEQQYQQLEQQYTELKAKNQLLKEQVKQNSKNSSKPPSQDLSRGFKPKEQKPNQKERGGQRGHPGHEPPLYPIEQCQEVEEHYPETCIECGAPLQGADPHPYRIQTVEIPKIVPQVCEHRFHALECQECGILTRAWDELIINSSRYGERVVAHVSILSGQYRQSHRMLQGLLSEVFGIELSVGSINQLRQESSQSISEAVTEAHQYVQAQSHANLDETGFAQGNNDGNNPSGSKGWLWVMTTAWVSYFVVALSRSQAVCQELLGEAFAGIVGSDRYSAYTYLEVTQRQVCWAHLKRDLTRIAERSGVSGNLGKALLAQEKLLFELWYRVRDGTLSRTELISQVTPIQQQVHQLLTQGAGYQIAPREKTPLAKTVRTCQQLLKVEPALWTFVTTQGVEPTNNAAERALRPAVLWRKNSFGSQSQAGSLFVSRMLTVVTTLRSQKRPVLEYLVEACCAARQGKSAPSLLPSANFTP
jgi:transposase